MDWVEAERESYILSHHRNGCAALESLSVHAPGLKTPNSICFPASSGFANWVVRVDAGFDTFFAHLPKWGKVLPTIPNRHN